MAADQTIQRKARYLVDIFISAKSKGSGQVERNVMSIALSFRNTNEQLA
jgi:hypothetical protein